MPVTIDGSNTPTAGGVGYGDGTELAFTSAGTAGQVLKSNGAGAPTWGSSTTNLATDVTGTLPVGNGGTGQTSLTSNNVILGNGGSAVQFVAPGSNGNVLTSNGTTWTSAAASGGLTLISTTTLSSPASTFAVTSGFSSTYDDYLVIVENLQMGSTFADSTLLRVYLNNNLQTSNYNTRGFRMASSLLGVSANLASGINITGSSDDNTSVLSVIIFITNANSSGKNNIVLTYFQNSDTFTDPLESGQRGGGCINSGVITGIQLYKPTYNFNAGTIRLYGIKK